MTITHDNTQQGAPVPKWECFCDESYYGQWAVRQVGERRWGHAFHLPSEEEGKGLCELLNEKDTQIDNAAKTIVELTS